MASSITITGIPPYDGVYPLDLEEQFFTSLELREIKLLTGVRAGELKEAMLAGDNDLLVAFAIIAVRRSGKYVDPDALWNAQAGGIEFDAGEEVEGEESLPPPSEPDASSSSNENISSSGATSGQPSEPAETTSEPSPVTQLRTGPPDSVTGVMSDQEMSAG